jgi:hypothetical protein
MCVDNRIGAGMEGGSRAWRRWLGHHGPYSRLGIRRQRWHRYACIRRSVSLLSDDALTTGARGTSRLNATAVAGATYRQSLYAMASARYDATDPDQKAKAREVEEMFFSGKVGDGDDDDDDKTANKKRKTK